MATTKRLLFSTDQSRWKAILRRERDADGSFFYGVKTTGVYCRPSCPSRLPRRSNVVFFLRCEEAERGGFRACKRCLPKNVHQRQKSHDAIIQACKLIETAEEPPRLDDLARNVGLSPFYFHRLFKEVVGVTPKDYASAQRVRRVQERLSGSGTVTEAIYQAGFGSSSRFYENTDAMLGMTPSNFRNGGAGRVIRFALVNSCLGLVMVAGTDRGICVIDFGETREALRKRLENRFPRARLIDHDPTFTSWVQGALALIETPTRPVSLPLDIQGTAFQQRVWRALRGIPAGSTATYGEIARRIGRPSATRAVARACASNPVAVAIPCHRIIGGDGDLKGYRWGVERKQKLLDRER